VVEEAEGRHEDESDVSTIHFFLDVRYLIARGKSHNWLRKHTIWNGFLV
jgi:hypothetical protein